jgi:hypothetical protein
MREKLGQWWRGRSGLPLTAGPITFAIRKVTVALDLIEEERLKRGVS